MTTRKTTLFNWSLLQKGKWRDRKFYIEKDSGIEASRKTITHEYPNTITRYVEDLGNRRKIYPIEALIENVVSSAELYILGNTSITPIATKSVPEVIVSDNYNVDFATNFSHSAGTFTYIGNTTIRASMDAAIYFQSTNNQEVNFYIALDTGAGFNMIASSTGPAKTQGASETTFANPKCLIEISTGDKLAIFVENTTSALGVLITGMNWTINS